MAKNFSPKPVMVSTREAAAMYSVASGTLQNWRSSRKTGPRWFCIGRKILYKVSDLEDFFTANPVLTMDSLPENRQ